MIEPGDDKSIRVLGSHWNRYKVRDSGTGIQWNKELSKWEVTVHRNLGSFDSIVEAAAILEKHLKGMETYLLAEFLSDDNKEIMPPTAIYMEDQAFDISRKVQQIEKKKLDDASRGELE